MICGLYSRSLPLGMWHSGEQHLKRFTLKWLLESKFTQALQKNAALLFFLYRVSSIPSFVQGSCLSCMISTALFYFHTLASVHFTLTFPFRRLGLWILNCQTEPAVFNISWPTLPTRVPLHSNGGACHYQEPTPLVSVPASSPTPLFTHESHSPS